MAPNNAWLAALKAACECSRLDDVADGILVAYSGHEALDNSLCFINADLAISGFDLDVCFHSDGGHRDSLLLFSYDRARRQYASVK